MQSEIDAELVEFSYQVNKMTEALSAGDYAALPGIRYGLEMAVTSLQMLGVDPNKVTPRDCEEARKRLEENNEV